MTHTTNYNLNKFESTDTVESAASAFNDNMDIIDSALGGYGLNRLEASDTVENAVSAFNANMDTIDSAMSGGGGTILPKTITANGTYNASADSADGYSPVTVNVPQPVITTATAAADLTGYEAGDTDLGNDWQIALGDGTAAVDSVTVGGVTYDGLAISGATTIASNRTLSGEFQVLEIELVTTALGSGAVRVVSTGGSYYEATVWYNDGDDYVRIVATGGTIIDSANVIDLGDGNAHDLSLPKTGLLNAPLRVKYVSNGTNITMHINDTPKVRWDAGTINGIFNAYGIHIGANGAAGSNILVSKAEYSGESLSWDGRNWVPV